MIHRKTSTFSVFRILEMEGGVECNPLMLLVLLRTNMQELLQPDYLNMNLATS